MESLRRASMADLRKKYQEVFQEETRCTHREHLFRRIAWRLQALAEGDLSERARGRAHQIAQEPVPWNPPLGYKQAPVRALCGQVPSVDPHLGAVRTIPIRYRRAPPSV